MNNKTFENYLEEKFMELYPEKCTNKDAMIQNFDAWMDNLESGDVITYAEEIISTLETSLDKITKIADELTKLSEQAVAELKKIEIMANELN